MRSWSDGSIVAECPQGLKSGVLVVEVTAGNGKSGSKGFLLQVPERPDDQSTPLFEKTIALPTSDEGLPVGVSYGLLTGWAVRYTCCQTTSAYRMRVLMRYGATTPIRTAGRSAPTYPRLSAAHR